MIYTVNCEISSYEIEHEYYLIHLGGIPPNVVVANISNYMSPLQSHQHSTFAPLPPSPPPDNFSKSTPKDHTNPISQYGQIV